MNDLPDGKIALGPGGPEVSRIGVGTNAWGSRRSESAALEAAFLAATDCGIDLFDTAEVYGMGASEEALGRCLAGAGKRPVVATKFFPMPWRLGRGRLIGALRRSLQRLGLPRVDLYMIHFPTSPVSIESWMAALADAVEADLTRAVGVSNYDAAQMRRAHQALSARGIALACNEVEYSLLNRRAERNGVMELCRDLGVTPIAYRPLALGFLSGKHTPEDPPRGWRGLLFGGGYGKGAARVVELAREIGQGHGGKSLAQVALNWVVCKGALPIPGATGEGHLRENAGALGWRLSAEEVAALEAAADRSVPRQ